MTVHGSGEPPDDSEDSWASEALPLAVRRALLERELHKLGFQKAGDATAEPQAFVEAEAPASKAPPADGEPGAP